MNVGFFCGHESLGINVPDEAQVYESHFPGPPPSAADLVREALHAPLGSRRIGEIAASCVSGDIVVVVSDITRPVPYREFLHVLLAEIEQAGVSRERILLLVATGMHRSSTNAEHGEILGKEIAARYRVEDHRADDDAMLVAIEGTSWAGAAVRLNRHFVEAGCRIVTGLVEPHFMAGFSGGRKSVCPGLSSLETLAQFHGHEFIGHPRAANGVLAGNPCHEEALSVARLANVDFCLNVVLDKNRRVVDAFGGNLECAHAAACAAAADYTCLKAEKPADVVVVSSGGHPLDTTFYQCVKGFVSCLPAVKPGGAIIAFGCCSEGVGSADYEDIMKTYAGRWHEFLRDIQNPANFRKDQWQFQMQCRALERVANSGLHFVTDGLDNATLSQMSVVPHAVARGHVRENIQALVDRYAGNGKSVAVFPEGPYCVAV